MTGPLPPPCIPTPLQPVHGQHGKHCGPWPFPPGFTAFGPAGWPHTKDAFQKTLQSLDHPASASPRINSCPPIFLFALFCPITSKVPSSPFPILSLQSCCLTFPEWAPPLPAHRHSKAMLQPSLSVPAEWKEAVFHTGSHRLLSPVCTPAHSADMLTSTPKPPSSALETHGASLVLTGLRAGREAKS